MSDITTLCIHNKTVNTVLRAFQNSATARTSFVKPVAIVGDIRPIDASDLNEPTRKLAITDQGLSIVSLQPDRHLGVTLATDVISLIKAKWNSTTVGQMLDLDSPEVESGIGIRSVAEILPVIDVAAVSQEIISRADQLIAYANDPLSWLGEPAPRLKGWPTLAADRKYAMDLAAGLRTGEYGSLRLQPIKGEIYGCLGSSPLMNNDCEGRFFRFVLQAVAEGVPLEQVRWTGSGEITGTVWFTQLPRHENLTKFHEFFKLDGEAVVLTERAVSFVIDRIDPENPYLNDVGYDDLNQSQRLYEVRR